MVDGAAAVAVSGEGTAPRAPGDRRARAGTTGLPKGAAAAGDATQGGQPGQVRSVGA